MTLPPILGIAGKAGSGKDTLAAYFVKKYGYVRYGFADPIKELLNQMFGWTLGQWEDREWKESYGVIVRPSHKQPAQDHLTEFDMERVKRSPRQLAQWLGTEVGRTVGGPDCWVNLMAKRFMEGRYPGTGPSSILACDQGFRLVIPDVRFENEALRIRDLGGFIIHLTRPNLPEVASHVSERGIQLHVRDRVIFNAHSIEELYEAGDMILAI
jgi:hypothetical protein